VSIFELFRVIQCFNFNSNRFFQNIDSNCLKLSSEPTMEIKTSKKEVKNKLRQEKKQMYDAIRNSKKEAQNKCLEKTINDDENGDNSFELDVIDFNNNN